MLSHTGVPLETLTLDWGVPGVLCATASRVYLLNDDRCIWILNLMTDGAHTEAGGATGVGELNGTARSKEGMLQLAYTYRLPLGAYLGDELQDVACMCFFDDGLIVADYEHGKLHTIQGC